MEERRRIAENIAFSQSIKMLAEAYEQISVFKMQVIRNAVLHTRDYLTQLADVFANVKSSYKNQMMRKAQASHDTRPLHFTTLKSNGKKVLVFLSANNKLYGDILFKIFTLFKEAIVKNDADLVIVGKVGKQMYETAGLTKPYQYFEISDFENNLDDLKSLISFIVQYEDVSIFYGKFLNVVTQDAVVSSLTGEQPATGTSAVEVKEQQFLFEPSIEQVLNFFETQVFSLLLKQTVQEAELAKYASRITAMEQAMQYITVNLADLQRSERRMKQLINNKKQQQRVGSIRYLMTYN